MLHTSERQIQIFLDESVSHHQTCPAGNAKALDRKDAREHLHAAWRIKSLNKLDTQAPTKTTQHQPVSYETEEDQPYLNSN